MYAPVIGWITEAVEAQEILHHVYFTGLGNCIRQVLMVSPDFSQADGRPATGQIPVEREPVSRCCASNVSIVAVQFPVTFLSG